MKGVKSAVGQSARGQSATDGLPEYGTNSGENEGRGGFVTRLGFSRQRTTTASGVEPGEAELSGWEKSGESPPARRLGVSRHGLAGKWTALRVR